MRSNELEPSSASEERFAATVTDIPESASSTAPRITGEHIEHEEKTRSRSASAGVLVPVGVVLMIGVIFVSVYVAAFHAPKPHGLPVVAVGTPPSVRQLARGLNHELPRGFSVDRASNPGVARVAIEHRRAYGAVVRSRGVVRLLYAGANGPAVTSLLTGVVGGAARREGSTFQARDVLPGAAGDTRGLSIFYAAFGLVLAGFLFGSVTYQIAPRLALRQRLLSLAAFGVTGGVLITLIVKAFGAVPGPFVGLASVTGLMAMAAAAASMTLVRLLGAAGVGLASVVLLVLGNSTSGGSLPRAFLPSWLHPFSEVLPVGVGVRALNGLAYFHHDGLLTGIAILGGWIAACAAALFARDAHDRRLSARQARPRWRPTAARSQRGGRPWERSGAPRSGARWPLEPTGAPHDAGTRRGGGRVRPQRACSRGVPGARRPSGGQASAAAISLRPPFPTHQHRSYP